MLYREAKHPGFDFRELLFMREKFSDCEFLIKTSDSITRYPCHKAVLISTSNVFSKILDDPSQANDSVIIVEGVDPFIIYKFLQYLYLGYVDIKDWMFACDMLKVARKYKIPNLIYQCEDYVGKNLTLQNTCYILETAIHTDSSFLQNVCIETCDECGFVILETDAFQVSDRDTLKLILRNTLLQIENEMTAFKAVWNWAGYRCCQANQILSDENIANEMGSLLELIGFKFMSRDEILTIPPVVLKKFRELCPKVKLCIDEECDKSEEELASNPEHSDDSDASTADGSTIRLEKQRSIIFPLDMKRFCNAFNFKIESVGTILAGNIIPMRFSVNTRVILKEIVMLYEGTVENTRKELMSMEVYNTNGTVASYCKRGVTSNLRLNPNDDVTFSFKAFELISVEAHEEYTIEVNRETGTCNIAWPLTSLECGRCHNVELSVLTERCYGMLKIEFVEAS